jgi:hypothetical protein
MPKHGAMLACISTETTFSLFCSALSRTGHIQFSLVNYCTIHNYWFGAPQCESPCITYLHSYLLMLTTWTKDRWKLIYIWHKKDCKCSAPKLVPTLGGGGGAWFTYCATALTIVSKFIRQQNLQKLLVHYLTMSLSTLHSGGEELMNWLKKSKVIPVTGRGGLKGCEMLRLPHFLGNRLTDGSDVNLKRRPPFTPRKLLCIHYC